MAISIEGATKTRRVPAKREKLDLLDTVLILFVSCAVVMFLFWISARFLNRDNFERLPGFITDSYSALWSAGISGGVGIGGALAKYFFEKEKSSANFLSSVFMTVLLLISSVIGIVFLTIFSVPLRPPVIPPPFHAEVLDVSRPHPPRDFAIYTPNLGSPFRLFMNGTISVQEDVIRINVVSWRLDSPPDYIFPPQERPATISVALCKIGHADPSQSAFFPSFPGPNNSRSLPSLSAPFNEAGINYEFFIRNNIEVKQSRVFLCGFLNTQGGGGLQAL